MAVVENLAVPQVELISQKVFYAVEHQFRSDKKHRRDKLPENVLLTYPRYFEEDLGLTFPEILDYHNNGISINIGEVPAKVVLYHITANDAMQFIIDDDMIKYWVTGNTFARLSDHDQWVIVEVPSGELLLVLFDQPDRKIISFTNHCLLYPDTVSFD